MGISGLYDFITACVSKNKSISAIRGQVVAIDMPCWVHRGAVQDAQNVVMYPEKSSEKINAFCLKRLELLKKHNITPICVFDGEKLPSKKATNDQRRARREENRQRAITALKNGESAWNYFIQAIRISPAITQGVKNMCKEKGYMVITAPYEADAQLAWLSREKRVDAVITEDSDLFIFGTNRLITKLQDDGKCQIVDLARIDKVKELEKFDDKLRWFRYACIMQGCDYFPKGIPGFGLKTSVKLLLRAFEQNDHSLRAIMDKKDSYFNSKQLAKWEANMAEKIVQAEDTFYYQLIVDTKNKTVKPFQPYPEGKTDCDYPQCGSIQTIEDVRKSLKEKDMNIPEATGGKAEVKMEAKDDPMILQSPNMKNSLKRKSYDDGGLRKKEFKPDTSWRLNLANAIGKESLLPVSNGCLKPMKSVVPGRKLEQAETTMRSKYFRYFFFCSFCFLLGQIFACFML
ncbi:unnamed protein product [Oikopleura dioica]|uniref:Exonuclease 1 n=1 Tax=Oikopleura dioica TaxID=34765 RepID=E4X4N7_OIKDI|nr:unnamed protein product [Oikopleura dioica]